MVPLLLAALLPAGPAGAVPGRSPGSSPGKPPARSAAPKPPPSFKAERAAHDRAVGAAQAKARARDQLPETRALRSEDANPAYDAPAMPQRMQPGTEETVDVTVTNTTGAALPADRWVLSYRWTTREGRDVTSLANQRATPLPADLAPGAEAAVKAQVRSPDPLFGNSREEFTLTWDLYDKVGRQWLSRSGVEGLAQDVTVEDATSGQLGLEKFYQYSGVNTGSGSDIKVNQFSGNAVWGYTPFSHPSRGPTTFLRLAYNSLDTSDVYAGPGWTISASSVQRLGTPLQFSGGLPGHPASVTLVDGDGTSHVYKLNKNGSLDPSKWTYDSPAGVHLRLQKKAAKGDRAWVMTKPDRTEFFFDAQGYQTAVVDKNGNPLSLTYERTLIGGRNTGMLKHITDATGRRTLTVDYYQRGDSFWHVADGRKLLGADLSLDPIINKVKSITDVSGRRLDFVYSDKGLLAELIDGAQDTRTAKFFGFFYDKAGLLDNPKLTAVNDPLGHGTAISYTDQPGRRWVDRLTDRRGKSTGFGYSDPDGHAGAKIQSTVTDANGHTSTYVIDGFGRPERVTNAKNQTSTLTWDDDNNVSRLAEAGGAVSTWRFDKKTGYPLEIRDPEANKNGTPPTRMTYDTSLDGYVADPASKTSPEGRRWTFEHDGKGNVLSVTDPKGNATAEAGDYTTRYEYDEHGQLTRSTDPNGNPTQYGDFDPSGYPRSITNALGHRSTAAYDVLGNVVSSTDPLGKTSSYTFDSFGRPLSSKIPKDQANGEFVFAPGPEYDKNDNTVTDISPNGAVTRFQYDANDKPVSVLSPQDTADSEVRRATLAYDDAGNLVRQTSPRGNLTDDPDDFTTTFAYDELNRPVRAVNAQGGVTTSEYDVAGNLVKTADPRKNATPDPGDYSARFVFDLNGRPVKTFDAIGKEVAQRFDLDGLVVGETDQDGNERTYRHDERGKLVESRVPHRRDGGNTVYRTTRYVYDQAGNRTKIITPRGVETEGEPDDFVQETVYDALNRVKEELSAYDPGDGRYNRPDRTLYDYDPAGRLEKVSKPPSSGESVRNDTRFGYYDNGWIKTSTDPWEIVNSYDYDPLGNQTKNTLTSAGGSVSRTMDWEFYPSGRLARRSDLGAPVGRDELVLDDSQKYSVSSQGDWKGTPGAKGAYRSDARTHRGGSGADLFGWQPIIPRSGTYEVAVRYPEAKGAAKDATYTITHAGGATTTRTVDQSRNAGGWVSLGSYNFTEGRGQHVTLSGKASGTVTADAVRLVRDNSRDVDEERKEFLYEYDADGNLDRIEDRTPGARIPTYLLAYDELDQITRLQEKSGDAVRNTTTFTYDENGNARTRTHDEVWSEFEYDPRDLVAKVTNARSPSASDKNVTTYSYTARGQVDRQTKPNGNTVEYAYNLDRTIASQTERKSGGAVVAQHDLTYGPNGDPVKDVARVMNADNHGATLDTTHSFAYDPRDRIARVDKEGDRPGTERFVHDANSNVIEQTADERTTRYDYDRNRLVSATTDGVTSTYRYDPLGRLGSVSSGGQTVEQNRYDGYDRLSEHTTGTGDAARRSVYTYDPFDRTATTTKNAGGEEEKRTALNYLGLTSEVLSEEEAGKIVKRYQASPTSKITQIKHDEGEDDEVSHYVYHPKGDVEAITDDDGNTRATYGYTAYGQNDESRFTGVDKPDPARPAKDPYNAYRFNGQRFDETSGTYDMGFRNYSPGLNRFLTRDMYAGALSDLRLAADPFGGSRYAFAGGNPITHVELDGHGWYDWVSGIGHGALDVVGLIPGVGEVADGINAAWSGIECVAGYQSENSCVDAALSAAAMIPFAGWGSTGAKWTRKGTQAAEALSDAGRRVDPPPTVRPAPDAPPARDPAPTPPRDDPAPPPRNDPAPPPRNDPAPPPRDTPDPPPRQDGPAACPVRSSFLPGTRVLMADGTSRPIEDVKAGDTVAATDPETGETRARRVTRTLSSKGTKRLVEITVRRPGSGTGSGSGGDGARTATVTATENHPFWLPVGRHWATAGELKRGAWLRMADGGWARVTEVAERTVSGRRVHNLTVAGTSTYHVVFGGLGGALVHNDPPRIPPGSCGGQGSGQPVTDELRDHYFGGTGPVECMYCGMPTAGAVEHRWPRSRGGDLEETNTGPVCRHCNSSKRDRYTPKNPPPGYVGKWPPPWWPTDMQVAYVLKYGPPRWVR
ncbi:RHS repeat-associated core domain-containing protein [Spirillospora sp. NPDC029432]|uniref:golvesin C-terminal-like domain-containing protein n=1 Tax=Spirillospora sp. NPDC029432 TaxID=3154599 RepID=UPI0034564FFC